MCPTQANKYREALDVLLKGRDVLIDNLADEVLDQAETLVEGGFLFNDFIESQGPRLHFLCILAGQLEFAADKVDEAQATQARAKPAAGRRSSRRRRSRSRRQAEEQNVSNIDQNASKETPTDDL